MSCILAVLAMSASCCLTACLCSTGGVMPLEVTEIGLPACALNCLSSAAVIKLRVLFTRAIQTPILLKNHSGHHVMTKNNTPSKTHKIEGIEVTSGNIEGLYVSAIDELESVFNHVDELSQKLNTLKKSIPEGSDLWQVVLQKMRASWTYHSNAIEGSTLSQGDTIFFLQEGLTVKGKPFKDFLDAKNHADAIDILFDVVANKREVSESFIKQMNELLLKGVSETPAQTLSGQQTSKPLTAGQYKRLPNHVLKPDGTLHQYLAPEQVSVQMETLVNYINQADKEGIHPVLVSAVAHYNMVRIHPFDDGNGRGARILMNLILMRAGYFPAIVKREEKDVYLTTLGKADNGNIAPFVQFIANQLSETTQDVITDLERLQ